MAVMKWRHWELGLIAEGSRKDNGFMDSITSPVTIFSQGWPRVVTRIPDRPPNEKIDLERLCQKSTAGWWPKRAEPSSAK